MLATYVLAFFQVQKNKEKKRKKQGKTTVVRKHGTQASLK